MNSYTAIEMMLQRRGYTGSVKCSSKNKHARGLGLRNHFRWGSWPAQLSLFESFLVYWSVPRDIEDSEAFERIEKLMQQSGNILIRARQGKYGTEYSVAGSPWGYRLKDAIHAAEVLQQ